MLRIFGRTPHFRLQAQRRISRLYLSYYTSRTSGGSGHHQGLSCGQKEPFRQIKIWALALYTASRLLSETIRDRRWGQKKRKLNKNFWPWRPQWTWGPLRVARHCQRPSEINAEVKRNHLSQKNSGLNDLNMKRHMFWVVRLTIVRDSIRGVISNFLMFRSNPYILIQALISVSRFKLKMLFSTFRASFSRKLLFVSSKRCLHSRFWYRSVKSNS